MDKIAFVFSGQGAQYPGMGHALYEYSSSFRTVFDRYEAIRPGTREQCFEGSAAALSDTVNAQPCLFALGLSAARALREEGVVPVMAAGFSLGEVAALAFSGVFEGEDGFRFVLRRAELMRAATEKHPGSMAAVLKLPDEDTSALCRETGGVYPVNYNCPGQLVVAGDTEKLREFSLAAAQKGGRVVLLKVSGAFHSPHMDEAAEAVAKELAGYALRAPSIPVYSNLTAQPYGSDPKSLMAAQVNHPVLWKKMVENMIADGANVFIEFGAGGTLCGLIRKINAAVRVINAESMEGFREAAEQYAKEQPHA